MPGDIPSKHILHPDLNERLFFPAALFSATAINKASFTNAAVRSFEKLHPIISLEYLSITVTRYAHSRSM